MRIVIYHANQDDPKKCTARKLARRDDADLVNSPRQLPYGAILLDPYAEKAVSREDVAAAQRSGIAAVDCSWETTMGAFQAARRKTEPRSLPFLVAANPVHFGQPVILSTLEALAAALIIYGQDAQADRLLGAYTWGPRFREVNAEPLAAYAACSTSAQVVAAMREFVPDEPAPADAE